LQCEFTAQLLYIVDGGQRREASRLPRLAPPATTPTTSSAVGGVALRK
jgi:hypothetical protein